MKQSKATGKTRLDRYKAAFVKTLFVVLAASVAFVVPLSAMASTTPSNTLEGYGVKIFRVESGLYPFVQVYLRSFNQDMDPLINLNERNLGLMVSGKVYDPGKGQYLVQSVRNREEMIRSIIVVDTSVTMKGAPFEAALQAAARFINNKRSQDQVAIIALSDNKDGYELVSNFERDPGTLGRRLADLQANGQKTRLYDSIGYAMQLGAGVGAGGTSTGDADYAASTSIVVFSDGKDEGSAISRSDLMTRITNIAIPLPIYSLAYTRIDAEYLKNLQALSKNSFGKYYHIAEAYEEMTRSVENIQYILQSDYVITYRAYLPIDGMQHRMKVGIEYPSGSGKIRYETSTFETLEPPTFQKILAAQEALDKVLPTLNDANPYLRNPFTANLSLPVPKPTE
jgi:Mg-chelatase subunit ChlD